MIRILIADDHTMVRQGLRKIIEAHRDMEAAGEAADGLGLLSLLEESQPDVLLLDISMPGPGFPEIMRRIRELRPGLPVLVVSMHTEEEWAVQALKAGAAGYLSKARSAEELAEAVRRVHGGGRYITAELADVLARRLSNPGPVLSHEALSPREFEVLRLLGRGKMVKTVARELGLSPRTVSTYRARILEKLHLRSTPELVRYAVEHDLIG